MTTSSAESLTRKFAIYFTSIALMVGVIIYGLSLSMLYWLEDEVNRRLLEAASVTAINDFQIGATAPLVMTNSITAYNDFAQLPEKYQMLDTLPRGFLDEITGENEQGDIFVYRTDYVAEHTKFPLILIMNADTAELTEHEWQRISVFVFGVTSTLFLLFGYALIKLTKRLIQPISQLSDQLHTGRPKQRFHVPNDAVQEFHQLTASLNSYQIQIEQLIEQEHTFSRYASHELRTPLTIIHGASHLLQHNQAPEFQQRQQQRIIKAANDMQNTVDALLSLVKQESRQSASQLTRLLTESEILKFIDTAAELAQKKSVSIGLNMLAEPEITPPEAVLRMLISNLINNAINASDGGEITITVAENYIDVADQGRGLSETELHQQGHGLGLLIVNALCQRYGWQFDLSDAPTGGCVARLTFAS
ncbi:sensor histidine kinase [Shewanella waksmanii]|uniref:HAMP domain-containing sensor histidine kinase n=1 Tax=Shewanella waksmanii TaxID=213783 RepID=UPI0037352C3A